MSNNELRQVESTAINAPAKNQERGILSNEAFAVAKEIVESKLPVPSNKQGLSAGHLDFSDIYKQHSSQHSNEKNFADETGKKVPKEVELKGADKSDKPNQVIEGGPKVSKQWDVTDADKNKANNAVSDAPVSKIEHPAAKDGSGKDNQIQDSDTKTLKPESSTKQNRVTQDNGAKEAKPGSIDAFEKLDLSSKNSSGKKTL